MNYFLVDKDNNLIPLDSFQTYTSPQAYKTVRTFGGYHQIKVPKLPDNFSFSSSLDFVPSSPLIIDEDALIYNCQITQVTTNGPGVRVFTGFVADKCVAPEKDEALALIAAVLKKYKL